MHCSISCHRPSPFDEDWETTMGKSDNAERRREETVGYPHRSSPNRSGREIYRLNSRTARR